MSNKHAIQELINKSSSALSHNELLTALGGSMNRVTIYRVLDRLVVDGSIHKIIDIDGVSKFASCDACDTHHHHHDHVHFSCVKCLSVTCLDDVTPTFKLPSEYIVEEVNFTLSGICPSCRITQSPEGEI